MFVSEAGGEFYLSIANNWPPRGTMPEYLYQFTFESGHHRQACCEADPWLAPKRAFGLSPW